MVALLIVFFASLVFSIYETAKSQPSAYFVTTTRAWEFAAGGLVAVLPALRTRKPLHPLASWVLLCGIVVPAFLFDAQTAFPGWVALVPVLGAAGLLWIGDSQDAWAPQYLSRSGPIQFLGDISYSVYLWHWPVIIVFIAIEGRRPGWKWILLLSAVIIAFAWLSKRFIEDPLRHGSGRLKRTGITFAATAGAMVIVLLVTILPIQIMTHQDRVYREAIAAAVVDEQGCFGAYAITNRCDDPYAITATVNPEATRSDTLHARLESEYCARVGIDGRNELKCEFPGVGTKTALYGDSHAEAIMPGFQAIAEQDGTGLVVHSRSGCSGFEEPLEGAVGNDLSCRQWAKRVLGEIEADETIGLVAIAIRTTSNRDNRDQAELVMRQLRDAGKEVILIRMVPGAEQAWPSNGSVRSAPACVESGDRCDWVPPAEYEDWTIAAAKATGGVPVLDTWDLLCDDGVCHTVLGGTIVYFDDNHLAPTFARTMAPWLRGELAAIGLTNPDQ